VAYHVFSAARLRGYRVLQDAGLGEDVSLQVLNTVVAARLWLPFSLIEIAFRNASDGAISAAHSEGLDWLLSGGRDGVELVAREVAARETFRGERWDGTTEDPVADAARMASRQLARERITRDDLIAHLMLGFWVHRCPDALAAGEPALDTWGLVAATLDPPLDDPEYLRGTMSRLLRTRNRVAHHEPLLFRAKHVFSRSGEPKVGADLVASLQGAVEAFLKDVQLVVATASAMAPMAAKHIASVPDQVKVDIGAFEGLLAAERSRLREERDARLAARASQRASRLAGGDS
jgi:hypothetical protein